MTAIQDYEAGKSIQMPASGSWPAAVHRFQAQAATALRTAEATGRPLLIRGLPGVGKSMTARAAAFVAGRPLLTRVIDSRTEPDDLKARFDAVRRLAASQVRRDASDALPDEAYYLSPQVLWWAFDWEGALRQQRRVHAQTHPADPARADADLAPVPVPAKWLPGQHRTVLLLDEIDKADPELPNSLLEAFAANGFTVPVTGQQVVCPHHRRPVIVITTNEERELPNAFLRRCLVLWLALPTSHDALVQELVAIGTAHQDWLMHPDVAQRQGACRVIAQAAKAVAASRLAMPEDAYQPGTSEFLDLVAALAELWPGDEAAQRLHLDELQQFALHKSIAPPARLAPV